MTKRAHSTRRTTVLLIFPGEATGVLRLAKALDPSISVSVIPMGKSIHDRSLPFAAEQRAAEIAAEVRNTLQPEDVVITLGYCLAGTVAALLAERLAVEVRVGLVLVDAPLPGHPYPYLRLDSLRRSWSYWTRLWQLRREGKLSGTSKHACKRKLLWHALRLARPVLTPFWSSPILQKKLIPAVHKNETWIFATMPPQRVPVLNFVCSEQSYFPMQEAVLGWEGCARAGYRQVPIQGDHVQAFFRRNIPLFVAELDSLIEALR